MEQAKTYSDGSNPGEPDGFLKKGAESDRFSVSYAKKADIPVTAALTTQFTAFDRYFCSWLGSTYPKYYADGAAGTLPQVAFIDPFFVAADGLANDDHPHADIPLGGRPQHPERLRAQARSRSCASTMAG